MKQYETIDNIKNFTRTEFAKLDFALCSSTFWTLLSPRLTVPLLHLT